MHGEFLCFLKIAARQELLIRPTPYTTVAIGSGGQRSSVVHLTNYCYWLNLATLVADGCAASTDHHNFSWRITLSHHHNLRVISAENICCTLILDMQQPYNRLNLNALLWSSG